MTFFAPERLRLLFVVFAFAVAYLAVQLRRPQYTMRFTNLRLLERLAPRRPGWRRHVPATLLLVTMGILVVAFARPAAAERVPHERATVIVAIDVSGSMAAADVPPTRLDVALDAAVAFVDQLPAKFNVGVVAFTGAASVIVAPGTDRVALRAAVDRLHGQAATGPAFGAPAAPGQGPVIGGQGTAIGEAIITSLEAIRSVDAQAPDDLPPARIVVLSDGNNTAGREPALAAQTAQADGVPVDSISFGTAAGVLTRNGRTVPVPVDGDTLESVASLTGGQYFEASSAQQLRDVYADIGSSVGYRTEFTDVSARVVGYGLFAAFVVAAASLAWFSRLP